MQTDNDILTDEAPQFAARPPNSNKTALLSDVDFTDIDVHVLTTPDEVRYAEAVRSVFRNSLFSHRGYFLRSRRRLVELSRVIFAINNVESMSLCL